MAVDLTAAEFRPFCGNVLHVALSLTGCETGAWFLDAVRFEDPDHPFPSEWQAAAARLRTEAVGSSAAMRPWPDKRGRLQVVLRQSVTATAGPLGELVLVGGPEDHLEGRGRLLHAYVTSLRLVLDRMLSAPSATVAVAEVEAASLAALEISGFGASLRGAASLGDWPLSLIGRLMHVERVGALMPTRTGALRYGEWPAAGADPGAVAAREDLAKSVAFYQRPMSARDFTNDPRLGLAGVTDLLGVPLPPVVGERGALLLLQHGAQPFTALDLDAAQALVACLADGGTSSDGRIDLETLQAAEARRLAGEIHDGPVQQLTGAAMETEVAIKVLDRDPRMAAISVQKARDEVRRVIAQLRSLIFDLRLANVSELGLVDALRSYAEEFASTKGLVLDFRIDGRAARLPPATEQSLFLIAREALINVDQHARATAIRVAVEFTPKVVTLRVEDNGVGFAVNEALAVATTDRHFGLLGMRERAERLRGRTAIVSQPNVGTIVETTVSRTEGEA